jgi:hypothetical protein
VRERSRSFVASSGTSEAGGATGPRAGEACSSSGSAQEYWLLDPPEG